MKTKFRNLALALLCLAVFMAGGVALYHNWIVQKPFGIVIFVSANLSPGTLATARAYQDGGRTRLVMEELPVRAVLGNASRDSLVPDAAAAATALSTGHRVNNGSAAIGQGGTRLTTLLEEARQRGRAIGLVSNRTLFNPVLAGFASPTEGNLTSESIGRGLMDSIRPDLLLGGGRRDWGPEHQGGTRRDEKDLLLEARQAGYDIVRTRSELNSTPTWRPARVVGVFADDNMAFSDEFAAAATQPSLADMVRQAIQLLQYNRRGYLLVVEAGLVEESALVNQGERMIRELLALDEAVAAALEYTGNKSLVIVAGTLQVGGFALSGHPHRQARGVSLFAAESGGQPAVTWATGPAGQEGVEGFPFEPSAVKTPEALPVAGDVFFFATGMGSEKFQGLSEIVDIHAALVPEL
jgi:alkaline phosphatase